MNLKSISMICAAFLMATNTLAAPSKVYKWTDSKGQTHYAQHPPYNTDTEVLKPQTGHSDPVKYSTPEAKAEKDKTAATTTAPTKDKERCDAARKNLETLKTYTRIRVKGEDGEFHFITPEEHAQRLAESNKAIEESCE